MRIIFDIDGTLTKFNKFIKQHKSFMKRKYNMEIINENGYDVDEIFDVENVLLSKQHKSEEEAILETTKMVNKFWNIPMYLKYCFTPFREGVKETINKLIADGEEVIICSSRKKAAGNNLLGKAMRMTIRLQFILNGINPNKIKIIMASDDNEKLEIIKGFTPDIVFEDKPGLISEISKFSNPVCVNNSYNMEKDFNLRVDGFENDEAYKMIKEVGTSRSIIEPSKINNDLKTSKNVTHKKIKKSYKLITETSYKAIKIFAKPIVHAVFKPIILNEDLRCKENPVVIAPNHRRTVDPFIISISTDYPIHWVALNRFFTGEDSIFNNNKNLILRYITIALFRTIGAIPFDRDGVKMDLKAIKDMCAYLKLDSSVGIFIEGTTNKDPDVQKIGNIKNGALQFAKIDDSWIQPISIVWVPKNLKIKNRIIINYRNPYKIGEMSAVETLQKWQNEVNYGIIENEKVINDLNFISQTTGQKKLKLKIK